MDEIENLPYAAKNAAFRHLAKRSALADLTPAERRSYEASLKAYRDRLTIRAQEEIERKRCEERAKTAREEAWAKGRAEREALATAICTKEAP